MNYIIDILELENEIEKLSELPRGGSTEKSTTLETSVFIKFDHNIEWN